MAKNQEKPVQGFNLRVLVIGGGISDEREVSLRSASSILKGALRAGHDAQFYDWDGSDKWLSENVGSFDVVLPILHGKGGEDGGIQSLLESLAARFLGSVSGVAKQCFDKQSTREKVTDFGYAVAKGEVLDYKKYLKSSFLTIPHVIKPIMGGSSIHTHILKNTDKYDPEEIRKSFDIYQNLLVEEYIDGSEITMAVLDGINLPVIEIIPPEGQLFDYENKYNGATTELCPPKNISIELQNEAIRMAKDIHARLGCRHITRTDVMVRDGKLYFLEINVMPGLTDQSLYPKAAKAVGLDFPQLVDKFIQLTIEGVY